MIARWSSSTHWPRDFTSGVYKFRSTDSASLPLESDLYRTITRGLARVSMPAFPLMPEAEKVAVIEYIKSLYPRWEQEKNQRVVVDVPRELQVERMLRDRGWSLVDAEARIAAQATREQRLAVATHVIENTGTLDELRARVAEVHAALTSGATA